MTMCAAITVPIIKDGYRLYPGMPVSNRAGNVAITDRDTSSRRSSQTFYFNQQSPVSGSPIEASMAPTTSSPPNPNYVVANGSRGGIIVGGASGAGIHHQVVLLQPRTRTVTSPSPQSQMAARSSFEVGPTCVSDPCTHRTAVSTSQLYVQKRRELCIQQQLQKQELAKKQQAQFQQQQRSSRMDADEYRKRKTSSGGGDQNNNSDMESSNPFRKLLRRLGFGSNTSTNAQRHVSFQDAISADCESGIEQAVSATEAASVAVAAWH